MEGAVGEEERETHLRRMRAGGRPNRKKSFETNMTLPSYLLGWSQT
jgi:hypothetical protein